MRTNGRGDDQLRPISLETHVSKHAEGSCLARFGDTHVLCTASVEDRVPPHVYGTGAGWVTAEYGMLPRSTHERMAREAARGKQGGRTLEIQRLIGRALRAAVDLRELGARTLTVDCDVLQADGGTRTAAITGGFVALARAVRTLREKGELKGDPVKRQVAAVSVGILDGVTEIDGHALLAAGSDPVRFGSSDLLSFSPIGSATAGTFYIRGRRKHQMAVRVLGVTGRVRVLGFDFRTAQWVTQ